MSGYLTFPYQIDASGRTATADLATYVQELILLVLETEPGERVNRPHFGGGLKSLVFAGMDRGLASAAETLVRGRLIQFLGDTIAIQTLTVRLVDAQVQIALTYFVTHTQELAAATVAVPLPGEAPPAPHGAGSFGRASARIARP